MQIGLFTARPGSAPAAGWVEECPGRWVRYSHPYRLMVQQDRPDQPWRWGCHRWPGFEQQRGGRADTPQEGACLAEAAFEALRQ